MPEKREKLTISVALCTCNGEKYLAQQLDSLVNQERLPDELIVCDDNSSDITPEIINHFSSTAPFPVKVFYNKNRMGFRKNFEQAALQCEQDVVFFCDQDDIWEREKLARFLDVFERQPSVGMVLCEAMLIDENNNDLGIQLSERNNIRSKNIAEQIKQSSAHFCLKNYIFWSGMAMAFRRKYLPFLVPFSDNVFHDLWCARLLSCFTEVRYLDQPLVRYRIHGKNASGSEIQDHGLAESLKQARNPGVAQYYAEVAQAMGELAERLQKYSDSVREPEMIDRFCAKGKHYQKRFLIQTGQISKVNGLAREIMNGNYFRYSQGVKSIAADLLS